MHTLTLTNVKIDGELTIEKLIHAVDERIKQYYCDYMENPEYEEILQEEILDYINYIKLSVVITPNGTAYRFYEFSNKYEDYVIVDKGKEKYQVYKRNYGKTRLPGRNKFAKKTKIKFDYATKYFSTHYILTKMYGFNYIDGKYYKAYNPNALYDWYQIGGRFDNLLLVKSSDMSKCIMEARINPSINWTFMGININNEDYKFALAARKKDIDLDTMKQIRKTYINVKGIFTDNGYYEIDDDTNDLLNQYIDSINENDVLVTIDIHI